MKYTAERLATLLLDKKKTLATAESCTGGMISSAIVGMPGVSSVFKAGFVTYANEAKIKMLGVSEETLKQYGAVSMDTAKQMAEGAAKVAECDLAISVTGIAGPDGGTAEKPVGLVYIGSYVDGKVYAEEHHFTGDRMSIREAAAKAAMLQLIKYL